MNITFTPCYRFLDLASLSTKGSFNSEWNGEYVRKTYPSGSSIITPDGDGSGIGIGRIQLRDNIPEPISDLQNQKEIVYFLFSNQFPVFYVGVSSQGLQQGVFKAGGRFQHHIRKLVASPNAGTNHTTGWRDHAVERYAKVIGANKGYKDSNPDCFIGDIWMSFGISDQNWSSKDVEGTVLDHFQSRLDQHSCKNYLKLNTAPVSRLPANITGAHNLKDILLR